MEVPQSFSDETVRESLLFAFFEHFLDTFLPIDTADQLDESVMHKILEHQALREAFSFIEFGGVYAGEEFLSCTWFRGLIYCRCSVSHQLAGG